MCSNEYTLLGLDQSKKNHFFIKVRQFELDPDVGEIWMRRKRNLMEKGDGVDGGDR